MWVTLMGLHSPLSLPEFIPAQGQTQGHVPHTTVLLLGRFFVWIISRHRFLMSCKCAAVLIIPEDPNSRYHLELESYGAACDSMLTAAWHPAQRRLHLLLHLPLHEAGLGGG
jgi:hypothetical protein